MLVCVANKLKSIFLGILNLIGRILCCVKKRRRSSDSGIPVSTVSGGQGCDSLLNSVAEASHWGEDDWDNMEVVIDKGDPTRGEEQRSTSEHISAYRHHQAAARQKSEEVLEEPDLFSDMVPTIKKQKKVFIGQAPRQEQGSRLKAVEQDPLVGLGAELGSWEEAGNPGGWEAEDGDMGEVLRETRRSRR